MSKFQMPFGGSVAGFNELTPFIQGYIEAMFFTSCDADSDDLEHATFDDIAGITLQEIINDCQKFQIENVVTLQMCYQHESVDYDAAMAGRDYWFTRNGHGVGYWDRGLGDHGATLSDCVEYTEIDLYRGDDGLLYLS